MNLNLSRAQIEENLDQGLILARMTNGRHWAIRRNGTTKLWKTRPAEFRIPVKAGLRSCGYITQHSTFGLADSGADFVVSTGG